MASKKKAIYPGTFDPITNGHVDLIERALLIFDEVIVLVAHSGKKAPLLTAEERKQLVKACFPKEPRVKVEIHNGLLVDYSKNNKVNIILRGLRGISDFDYEFQMATMNTRMQMGLETCFLMASERFFFINSTLVKEVFFHGGNVKELVPPWVEKKLREKL